MYQGNNLTQAANQKKCVYDYYGDIVCIDDKLEIYDQRLESS